MDKKWILTLLITSLWMVAAGWTRPEFPIGTIMADRNNQMKITFEEDGSFKYEIPSGVVARVDYSIKKNKLIWGSDIYCHDSYTGATYEWVIDENKITFDLVGKDGCTGRRETLQGIWLIDQSQ